jgi:hypothetical protein
MLMQDPIVGENCQWKEYTAREIMEMQNKLKTFLPEWEPV